MRKPIIAGNWKMNLRIIEAIRLAQSVRVALDGFSHAEVVLCPPFTSLFAVSQVLKGSSLALGGQNCYPEKSGAFTGEISPMMLLDIGCTWTILGHSERRHILGETNRFINEKVRFALQAGLQVMLCIGETLEEREKGVMDSVLREQVYEGLREVPAEWLSRLVIAYEPVWAIGTGVNATPSQAEEAHQFVRSLVSELYGDDVAQQIRIQYGGSVKPQNARELFEQPNVDGFLVGGASLSAEQFVPIVKVAETVAR